MMETTDNNPMTLAELEALAELYFEASLSRADEGACGVRHLFPCPRRSACSDGNGTYASGKAC